MAKKGKQGDLMVLKFASHHTPEAKQMYGKDWVYFGKKNDYFQYLLDLYYKASKHAAIVNGKAQYIAGAGWVEEGGYAINAEETLNAVTKKVVLDYELYKGFAMEVIWTKGGKIAEFRHVDFSRLRTNKDETVYYYTKDWVNDRGYPTQNPQDNEDWKVYEPFDPNNRNGEQLIYFKGYSPSLEYYPLPEYKAALLYIELEYQIANYWYNRVKNGFMPSAILNFYMGQPSNDEMTNLEDKIKEKFAGTDNAGQFIINFAANKDSSADIQQISPPELGKEYESLNTQMQTEIFTGHGVTSGMLFGIKEQGQLGGRTEIIEANELFQERYVTPRQEMFEEFFAKFVFPYTKISGKEMELKQMKPIGYMFSEATIIKYLNPKVIGQMIAEKMGVEYDGYEPPKEEPAKFNSAKEKSFFERLKKTGKKRNGKILLSRPVDVEMTKDIKKSEEDFTQNFKKVIPPLITGTPLSPQPAPGGKTEVISVVYKYDWADGFSNADIDTSRDFCKEMLKLSAQGITWTREDIEGIDNETNDPEVEDAWESRGGWYNDQGTAVPHCRHIWVQQIIREII